MELIFQRVSKITNFGMDKLILHLQSDNLPCTPSLMALAFSITNAVFLLGATSISVIGLSEARLMQFSLKYGISRQLVREKLIMDFHFIYDELMHHNVRKVLLLTINNPEKSLFSFQTLDATMKSSLKDQKVLQE